MVSSQDGDSILVPNFKCEHEADSLYRVIASIDIVSEEQVVGVGDGSSNFEQLYQVVELAVDVTADEDGSFDWDDVGLLGEDLSRLRKGYLAFSQIILTSCSLRILHSFER